jgi:hypothetical protein
VRNTLLDQPNVGEVAIDFDTKIAYIMPAEGATVDTDAAIKALEEEQYGATVRATP